VTSLGMGKVYIRMQQPMPLSALFMSLPTTRNMSENSSLSDNIK